MANRTAALASVVFAAAIIGVSTWAVSRRQAAASPVASETTPQQVHATDMALVPAAPVQATSPQSPVRPDDVIRMLAANDAAAARVAEAGERKLRGRYEAEQIDRNWAARKQEVLRGRSVSPQIDQVDARPRSFDIACRTSVCRIDADLASATAANDWFTLFTLNAGGEMFNSSMRSSSNPDGSIHLQIYGSARQ